MNINEESRQIFNKVDLLIRNELIRIKYAILREQGYTSQKAQEILATDIYTDWTGEHYFLTTKSIINIISGQKNDCKRVDQTDS